MRENTMFKLVLFTRQNDWFYLQDKIGWIEWINNDTYEYKTRLSDSR